MDFMTEANVAREKRWERREDGPRESEEGPGHDANGRSGTRPPPEPPHSLFLYHDRLRADTPKMSPDSIPDPPDGAGSSKHAFSLENILGADHENVEHPTAPKEALTNSGGWDEEEGQQQVAHGFCIECEGVYIVA